ncbi:MAG: hypothetical protein AB1505_05230 [Candidatus Latescibacterota bacterium]
MRSIFVGIEYAGKSTLIQLLAQYYRQRQLRPHLDDHFSIPDATLPPESQRFVLGLPDAVKERMQRMQIQYHVDILQRWKYPIFGGWHIEEAVYTSVYGHDPDSPYYPNYSYQFHRLYEAQVVAAHLPDLILFHVTASDEALRQRMRQAPHQYPVIRAADVPQLKRRFEEEVAASLFTHQGCTVVLDTTDKTPQESLDELLLRSEPLITPGELALRSLPVPDGEYEVRYEGGVRRLVPRS